MHYGFLIPLWFLGLVVCWGGWLVHLSHRKKARAISVGEYFLWAGLVISPIAAFLAQDKLLLIPGAVSLATALQFLGMCLVERMLNRSFLVEAQARPQPSASTSDEKAQAPVAAAAGPAVEVLPPAGVPWPAPAAPVSHGGVCLAEQFRVAHAHYFYGDAHYLVEAAATQEAREIARNLFEFPDGSTLHIGGPLDGVRSQPSARV